MALFAYIILLAFANITVADDCIINNTPERVAFEKELRKDLKCGQQEFVPPSGNTTLTVNVRFLLKRFSFDSAAEVMTMKSWMFITWKDERLKWDPDKYYGIKSTRIISVNIWNPGFRLFNSADSYDFDRFYYVWCDVNNIGYVHCVVRVIHNAICNVKLTNWPYDEQECSLEFGVWSAKSDPFTMNFTSRAMNMLGAEYEAEWFISDYRQEANQSSERQLKMIFLLEREARGLAAIVVYPAMILTVLSITSLFLDVRRFVRLSIACFSIFGHYYFLAELAANIPKKTSHPPNLLFYYRGSVVLTILIILVSFLMRIITKLKSTPQNYIISVNNAVFESYGKYFIFPLWNVEDDSIDIKRFSRDWTKFANIINSAFGLIIIITYVIMCCALVPTPIPIKY